LLALAFPALAKPTPAGGPAPRFSLPATKGVVALDSLRGQVVLVDFWASWCEPCRKSFPWMADVYRRYSPQGFSIVAINLDKERDAADHFLAQHPAPFTIAFDPNATSAEAFHVRAMPSSFLIGRDGTILDSHAGFDPRKVDSWESRIREACAR